MGLSALNDKWNGNLNAPTVVVILCSGISLFNALELLLLVLITFKAWKGLYFWSLFIASLAVIPYSVGYLVVYFARRYGLVGDVINNIGWIVMVTGQSVVLYSRLHLILHDQRILRSVKWMIVTNAVVFYVATTITHYGTFSHSGGFDSGFQVIEKLQMTGFCVQEFIISALYMKEVSRFLKIVTQEGTRRTMWELLLINMIIVLLDIGLLIMEYLNLRIFEQTFKGVAYSVKLKMELAILGKLVTMAQSGNRVIMENGDLERSGSPGGHTISCEVSHRTSSALEPHSSIVKEYRMSRYAGSVG